MEERRKHHRYKAREGIIAFRQESSCKIIDISRGGLSLLCSGQSEAGERFSVDILLTENDFRASLPVRRVWEDDLIMTPLSIFRSQLGCRFAPLTDEQQSQLEYLLSIHQETES